CYGLRMINRLILSVREEAKRPTFLGMTGTDIGPTSLMEYDPNAADTSRIQSRYSMRPQQGSDHLASEYDMPLRSVKPRYRL
ncbi:hypothetical protein DXG03_008114, partial [Asterophora parasitica]